MLIINTQYHTFLIFTLSFFQMSVYILPNTYVKVGSEYDDEINHNNIYYYKTHLLRNFRNRHIINMLSYYYSDPVIFLLSNA